MNARRRVQAAIDKLTAQKAASTPGPWAYGGNGYVETIPEFDLHRFDVMPETVARVELQDEDGELIVTLHRTLDPLLATLERWLEYRPLQMEEPIVALADAILGADS